MDGPAGDRGQTAPTPRLWAVGGGKGGVGKSVVTSNLGLALARLGHRTVLFDADLGGANLHTLSGIPSPSLTLSNFLARDVADLAEAMAPTRHPDLFLISGSRALMEMANPKHAQKEKILRHLASLPADVVIMDLGAGTAFNVLDFFLVAERGVLVVIPEPTSVENAYHFIRSAFYRRLKRAMGREGVAEAVDKAMEEKIKRGIRSPRLLVENVLELDPRAGESLLREVQDFSPSLVVNQVVKWGDRELGKEMAQACRDYFGIQVHEAGFIEKDPSVAEAVKMKRPALEAFPGSSFARDLQAVALRLLHPEESP